ncbi:hypothetical protein [Acidovorax sp.]|jgi:hypothetical protein|uniref:hypothetical protein n=1 Tax=Acidovorax sp. TaxID=1872122 RepID=UPI0025C019AA|nr:hypothetical protein [Acidovorax sp.]MBW8466399.1 hypothetical protein [Acidovorax sp.]
MKIRKAIGWGSALVLSMTLFGGAAIARTADMYDAPRVLSVSANPLDARQMRDRIVAGGQALGWAVIREEQGLVELRYDKQGKHQVTVAVRYDPSGYKIDYVDSFNLNYAEQSGVRKIHPNYNRWILNLIKYIGPV